VISRGFFVPIIKSRGELFKRFVGEPIQEQTCGVEFPRNHKLYKHFNSKITQLIEAGITEKYRKTHLEHLNPKYYEKPRLIHKTYLETTWRKSFIDEPKILTMKNLEFGFVIWLGSLILPLLGFIFEWLNKLKDFFIIKFLLAAYFERKHSESRKIIKKIHKIKRNVEREYDNPHLKHIRECESTVNMKDFEDKTSLKIIDLEE
jgi:hypothetical protein